LLQSILQHQVNSLLVLLLLLVVAYA